MIVRQDPTNTEATLIGGVGYLPLHDREGHVKAWAMVDSDVFASASKRQWSLLSTGYAVRQNGPASKRSSVLLQRFVLGFGQGGPRVRFLNGDTLDCRRENLSLSRAWVGRALRDAPQLGMVVFKLSDLPMVA